MKHLDRKCKLTIDQIRKILDESDDETGDDFSADGSVYDPESDKSDSETDGDVISGGDDIAEYEHIDIIDSSNPVSPAPSVTWHEVTGSYRQPFLFTASDVGLKDVPTDGSPVNFFELFVNSEIINLIVTCTNKVARLKKENTKNPWRDVDETEIKRFLSLIMYFGLVQYPSIKKYWSKDRKYFNYFVRSAMPRNRFEEILRFIHFSNEDEFPTDRLKKIRKLITLLNNNFHKHRIPGENITIDETVVPFRGRLKFRQYLPGKAHKYGVKLFKACDPDGYTYILIVYSGKKERGMCPKKKVKGGKCCKRKAKGGKGPTKKANCEKSSKKENGEESAEEKEIGEESAEEKDNGEGSPEEEENNGGCSKEVVRHSNQVVMELLHNYLDEGRTLVADNYYNNLDLASQLLKRKTHLVGTLRLNTKGVPKTVLHAKLKKGEVTGQENEEGIVVGNWRDKRYVRFITTKHTIDMKPSGKNNRKGQEVSKPEPIMFYNKNKQGVDISDQMTSYFSPLRKTIRWFHKVAFTALLGTAIVNAWILYKLVNKTNKIQISEFREAIIENWMQKQDDGLPDNSKMHHILEKTDERDKNHTGRAMRRRCTACYKKISSSEGRKVAMKKARQVTTRCITCLDKPYICLPCFSSHNSYI